MNLLYIPLLVSRVFSPKTHMFLNPPKPGLRWVRLSGLQTDPFGRRDTNAASSKFENPPQLCETSFFFFRGALLLGRFKGKGEGRRFEGGSKPRAVAERLRPALSSIASSKAESQPSGDRATPKFGEAVNSPYPYPSFRRVFLESDFFLDISQAGRFSWLLAQGPWRNTDSRKKGRASRGPPLFRRCVRSAWRRRRR